MIVLSERLIPTTPGLTPMEFACNHYLSLRTDHPKTMALFSQTAEVQEFNQRIIDSLGTLTISIASIDKELKIGRRRKQRPWQNRENSILNVRASSSAPPTALALPTIAGGLTSNLLLTKNARVMLKRNIDQSKGLVNGLTGVLEEVIVEAGSVTKLSVRFDRIPNEVISITRIPVVYSGPRGSRHCRLQFPIELAYAVSIHKSQGLTLDSVMLSTESIFAPSQLYVAASRVKRLAGLHLIDLNPARAYSKISAVAEYNRLRTTPACPFQLLDLL